MIRPAVILGFCLLLCACTGKTVKEYPPEETDSVGITVPEDAVPEYMKPGSTDTTADSSR
jgi:hypothetical protein